MQNTITFRDAQVAFNEAIQSGRLSENDKDKNFAGLYMYMYTHQGKDLFKNKHTRKYLP
jgi:hypothetical protein